MSSSGIKELFNHTALYAIGRVVVILSGFISFPILTRALEVSEYGRLALINATLIYLVAISKSGFPGAFVRFFRVKEVEEKASSFYNTFFLATLAHGLIVTIAYLVLVVMVQETFESSFVSLLILVSVLIVSRSLQGLFFSFLRSQGKVLKYNILEIILKYGSLIFGLTLLLYYQKGLYGYLAGIVLFEVLATLFVMMYYLYHRVIGIVSFDTKIYADVWRFGKALVGFELAGVLLYTADRYMIAYFYGEAEVGLYAVGYNLASYIQMLLAAPIALAIVPLYMKLWHAGKKEELEYLLSKSFKYFVLAAIPTIFGAFAVKNELITILATDKYEESAVIFPIALIGVILFGAHHILAAGIYIRKSTEKLMQIAFITLILNITLNYILIPRMGIIGGALSTMVSYVIMLTLIIITSFKRFSFPIAMLDLFRPLIIAAVMGVTIAGIHFESNLSSLVVKVLLGTFIYVGLLISFDSEVRTVVKSKLLANRKSGL